MFIAGSDDNAGVRAPDGSNTVVGNTDIYRLLGFARPLPRIQLAADFFERTDPPDLRSYRCLFNLISDPDQNPKVIDNLQRLVRGYPGRVINRPDAVLMSTRDRMAAQLEGTPGLRVPRVVRLDAANRANVPEAIEQAGLRFPLILRQAGSHAGRIIGLFADVDELRKALPGEGDLIATEFVDFRSEDGLYRKYRIFVFGRSIVLRHMLASDTWNIHARDRKRFMLPRPALREEERRLLARPRHALAPAVQETLATARKRIGLDYYGMDFGIAADGRVVLFEANATMNFFPFLANPEFRYVRQCLPIARRACRQMVPELFPASLETAA